MSYNYVFFIPLLILMNLTKLMILLLCVICYVIFTNCVFVIGIWYSRWIDTSDTSEWTGLRLEQAFARCCHDIVIVGAVAAGELISSPSTCLSSFLTSSTCSLSYSCWTHSWAQTSTSMESTPCTACSATQNGRGPHVSLTLPCATFASDSWATCSATRCSAYSP